MRRSLRLLWVCPDLPRLGMTAARERWWNLLARLAAHHEISLLAFVDPREAEGTDLLPPGLARVRLVPRLPFIPDDPLALLPPTVRGGVSHPALAAAVREEISRAAWDLVQFEYIEMGHVMPPPVVPTVLTVHQIGFAQVWPRWRAAGGGVVAAGTALFRYCRDLDFELQALARAHHIVAMSTEDAARLTRFVPDLAVSVSPVGVDCGHFRPPEAPPAADIDLLFVGHFGHPPNVDAVSFLCQDVLPRLRRPVRVRLVGHAPPPAVQALARAGAVEVTGPVPDVRPHLAAARMVVAPVRFGTGMRGKVLEALAMGRPLVTTSLGAEGVGAVVGRHLLVADDAPAFANAITSLLDDPARAAALGKAARSLAVERFDWDIVARAHEDIYARTLATPRQRPAPTDGAMRIARRVARLGSTPGLGASALILAARALGHHTRGRRPHPFAPQPGADAAVYHP